MIENLEIISELTLFRIWYDNQSEYMPISIDCESRC